MFSKSENILSFITLSLIARNFDAYNTINLYLQLNLNLTLHKL